MAGNNSFSHVVVKFYNRKGGALQMNRHKAIEVVSKEILKDGLVEALFLKGSIARGDDDDWSDVDMYAAVTKENREKFLDKRICYMEKYLPLVFWVESNFVGPQIVGVYEDFLHFDLYTVDVGAIPQTDSIKIIYDKNGVLDNYQQASLGISDQALVSKINGFTFTLLEFHIAHSRGDLIWATHLFAHQMADVSVVARYIHSKDTAQLGLKALHKAIPSGLHDEIQQIRETATASNILPAMTQLAGSMAKLISQLPQEIQTKTNQNFFKIMLDKLGAR